MGGSASKSARTAGSAARKYPSRIPPTSTAPRPTNAAPAATSVDASVGPSVHPEAQAPSSRTEAVNLDASDPDLALNERMRQLGPVQPNPTFSNSSTFNSQSVNRPSSPGSGFMPSKSSPQQSIFPNPALNPAVLLLEARQRLAEQAEEEFDDVGRLGKGKKGREFLDVVTIRQILRLRDQMGRSDKDIEEGLQLREGLVGRLGKPGLVSGSAE